VRINRHPDEISIEDQRHVVGNEIKNLVCCYTLNVVAISVCKCKSVLAGASRAYFKMAYIKYIYNVKLRIMKVFQIQITIICFKRAPITLTSK